MDDPQAAFAAQYPSYPFDIDMMKVRIYLSRNTSLTVPKRSMDPVGGPDAKKARWSPTFAGQNSTSSNANARDAFANYGYGPQASIAQSAFNNSPTSTAGFAGSPLYTTPSLSVNTQSNGAGMPSQLSPNNAAAAFAVQQSQQQQHGQQQQQQSNQQQQGSPNGSGYASFGGYNMLGMGLPGMTMLSNFPYNGQMANFAQVTPFPWPASLIL
jgi:hypothetical protein